MQMDGIIHARLVNATTNESKNGAILDLWRTAKNDYSKGEKEERKKRKGIDSFVIDFMQCTPLPSHCHTDMDILHGGGCHLSISFQNIVSLVMITCTYLVEPF